MSVIIYHNPKCSKSRQTLELLRERGVEPTIVEYLKTPPSVEEVRQILNKLGLSAKQVIRAKEAKEVGVDLELPETALVEAMADNPAVIERPIVVNGDKAAIGRPPENVLGIL